MSDVTTIQLDKKVVNDLKEIKGYPRQSYNELIMHLIELEKKIQSRNQYDRFIHNIQQSKMNELWSNKEDEAWENV